MRTVLHTVATLLYQRAVELDTRSNLCISTSYKAHRACQTRAKTDDIKTRDLI